MTTFDKREEGFEKQFVLEEELRFKAKARRNRLLGLWAAEKLGLSGADAQAFAKEVVLAVSSRAATTGCSASSAQISTTRACSNRIIRFAAPWTS